MDLTDEALVDELCEIEDGLTPWKVEFVDSIAKALKSQGNLSPAQRAKAEQIHEEKA